jgi:hypothetical protein
VRFSPWCLVALLIIAVPAPARAATEQVIAARDAAASVAVDDRGRAFVVTPSAPRKLRALSTVRARSAAPGALFGPARTLMRSSRAERAVAAGVAADGSGVIVVQAQRRSVRRVRVVAFDPRRPGGGRPVTVSVGRGSADFAAAAVAASGAAVVAWFRHRGDRRWRLEVAVRAPGRRAFGAPQPLTAHVRRACCTSVAVAVGDRGDAVATWSSTARPAVWASLRRPGRRFRRPQRLARRSSGAPRVVVGAGGTAALTYGLERVPRRAGDGVQLHRAVSGGVFGAAEQVGAGCAAASGEAAVTPAGHVLLACVDRGGGPAGARVRVFEAAPGQPLVAGGELGTRVTPERLAVAADDAGRAVVAWPQLVTAGPPFREQAVAAMRHAHGAPFAGAGGLGRPWSAAEPGLARLAPGGGALVVWRALRHGPRVTRRAALVVTRLP